MDKHDIPAKVMNAAFVDKIQQGFVKEAASTATSYIRDRLREESFLADKILTEHTITADQLDKNEDLDELQKIVEREPLPDSEATWVTFKGMPAARYLKQKAGVVKFGEIQTDKVVKNIFELKTSDNDVRQIVADNQVKDVLKQQDGKFIETCEAIMVANPTQDLAYAGGLTKVSFIEAMKALPNLQIGNAKILFNEATGKEFLKWDTTDIGYEMTTYHYKSGLGEGKIMGIPFISTIKNDIVDDNVVWFFGPEDFLGKFFTLQEATVFMKSEGPFIEFFTYKCLGMGIFNTKAVIRATFTP
jgi:hypothetical protein